jgi:hypothetical protein
VYQGMTEADKEIIEILKELFRNKNNELIDPDDLLRETIVKGSIYLALFCVVALVLIKIFGHSGSDYINEFLSGVIGVTFTLIFVHLNTKSKIPNKQVKAFAITLWDFLIVRHKSIGKRCASRYTLNMIKSFKHKGLHPFYKQEVLQVYKITISKNFV